MDKKRLDDLINGMAFPDNTRNSFYNTSWRATRKSEKLKDLTLLPILEELIMKKIPKKDKNHRREAYFIYGKILKNSFTRKGCEFLIQRLTAENDKYILSEILDRLSEFQVPPDMDISPIIFHSQNSEWLVRHSAILALGSCPTQKSRDALYSYLLQSDEKTYEYEIVYANVSMGKIGKLEDIPILELHTNSRIHDIETSAKTAIKNINTIQKAL